MLTSGVHHVSLVVRDIERSRSFYGEIIGLPEIERPDFGFPGAWFQAGSVQLHLIVPPDGLDTGSPAPKLTPIAAHIAFEVDDYEAVEGKLQAAGLTVVGLGAKVGQLFARDPDGNVLEFIQPGGQLGRARGPA